MYIICVIYTLPSVWRPLIILRGNTVQADCPQFVKSFNKVSRKVFTAQSKLFKFKCTRHLSARSRLIDLHVMRVLTQHHIMVSAVQSFSIRLSYILPIVIACRLCPEFCSFKPAQKISKNQSHVRKYSTVSQSRVPVETRTPRRQSICSNCHTSFDCFPINFQQLAFPEQRVKRTGQPDCR